MKIRQLSNWLLMVMVLVCCSQQIWAGVVKGSKGKNSTVTTKSSSQTTKQPKVSHKSKTTTTTTTAKPELETTTLPADIDLDGRSAFINNQYVADPEPTPDSTPPLYELLQQQMETVLSNTGNQIQVYANDSPQMKEAPDNGVAADEAQKPPGKPIFGYDMGQFDDYDEEDVNEYSSEGEYIPDNCEDTQESLGDNDGSYVGAAQLTHANLPTLQNNYGQDNTETNIFEHSTQTKPYDSSNYGPQTTNNQGTTYNPSNKPNESNNYGSQTNTNQGQSYGNNSPQNGYGSGKPPTQHNHKSGNKSGTKSKTSQYNNQNGYTQKPTEQYQQSPTNQYGLSNQKPLSNQNSYNKPPQHQYNTVKPPQNSYSQQKPLMNHRPYSKPSTTQQSKPSKPNQNFNSKPSHNSNYPIPVAYNNTESLSSPYGNFNSLTTSPSSSTYGNTNSLNPSLAPNFSYGNTNTVTSSPFSGNNKIPHNGSKRHLTFRTVSSSTQYVSTPLADLMFKFSIGMAKHGNSKLGNNVVNNQAQVFNVLNDIDEKTE